MPKETILAIEDEKDVLKLLQYNLEKEGYTVLSAENGEKGLELARAKKPALILLDVMLPGIDGLEVCRLLKADRETRSIPVFMLTAKGSDIDQVVGLELGASDYLPKPFGVKVLLARIKNLLKAKLVAPAEDAVVQRGDFVLDRERMRFMLKGKLVALTKTEFRILGVLMEREDIVFTRENLVSSVWGSGVIVSEPALNMQIKSLRAKLGKYRDCIETVRGSGYRFIQDQTG